MNYSKLKDEIRAQYQEIKLFFEKESQTIGMTDGGFYQAVRNQSMKISTIELISQILKKPMAYWWEDESGNVNDPTMQYGNRYEGEINALKMLIKELQELKQKNNEKLDQQEAEIKMLNTERRTMLKERQEMIDEMEELRRSCGLKKEGTSGS